MANPRVIVLTAPSGAGKTSIARRALKQIPELRFSVSATTRARRSGEENGVDYFFLSEEDFLNLVQEGKLVEYEEVYPGRYYGTLRSELDAATTERPVLLDIDVRGAEHVKELYGEDALVVFVAPPSMDELESRLRTRGTEDEQTLGVRLSRSRKEMEYLDRFDAVVVNDDLERATRETTRRISTFLGSSTEPA
ncbi:MAG: guanylate kinase [Bacteroidetes bacterium]|nr:guanylate kinase [Bacteroidota bacterium]